MKVLSMIAFCVGLCASAAMSHPIDDATQADFIAGFRAGFEAALGLATNAAQPISEAYQLGYDKGFGTGIRYSYQAAPGQSGIDVLMSGEAQIGEGNQMPIPDFEATGNMIQLEQSFGETMR